MVHTLGAEARISSWIGYEIFIGLGVGPPLQVPMIANQAAVSAEDIAAVTSLTLFCENIGTAIFIASTEATFTNGLVKALAQNVPNLRPEAVVNAGATEIRSSFSKELVPGILLSYLHACKESHFVPIASGSVAALVSMMVALPDVAKEWQIRTRKPHAP